MNSIGYNNRREACGVLLVIGDAAGAVRIVCATNIQPQFNIKQIAFEFNCFEEKKKEATTQKL